MNTTNDARRVGPSGELERHIKPHYYGYFGGFAKVGKCKCGIVSLYEDFHPATPCWVCGETTREWFSARWVSTKKWWQWRERGYWLRSNTELSRRADGGA